MLLAFCFVHSCEKALLWQGEELFYYNIPLIAQRKGKIKSNSIPQFSTHICFVSQQPVPNLMLAMNPDSKPKKIYLLSSQDMLDKGIAKNLQNMFKKVSVAAEIVPLQSLSFFR